MKRQTDIYYKTDIEMLLSELEQYRVSHKLSQTALARKIGLRSYQTLFYWYKGKSKPYPRHLWRIIQILGKRLTIEEYTEWQKEKIK